MYDFVFKSKDIENGRKSFYVPVRITYHYCHTIFSEIFCTFCVKKLRILLARFYPMNCNKKSKFSTIYIWYIAAIINIPARSSTRVAILTSQRKISHRNRSKFGQKRKKKSQKVIFLPLSKGSNSLHTIVIV